MAADFIPYSRQEISEADIAAVVEVLRSPWLTTGPAVAAFEEAFTSHLGGGHAVAVCNGTAALHTAMFAIGIGPGDEVILPPMTFSATANAVLYQGGTPVFADVLPDTLLIDPARVEEKITPATKAIVAVDYAGAPCDYNALRAIAERHSLVLVADACHSLGGSYHDRPCGTLADISAFSFHPVKPITSAEGGMVVTERADWAERMRRFRNHGLDSDHRSRAEAGIWQYRMVELGFNYRLTDLQCALGLSQLQRLEDWTARRRALAERYRRQLAALPEARPLAVTAGGESAWHLFVVRVPERDRIFPYMRDHGIGVNVHYTPVHLHPYYRQRLGTGEGLCPVAEASFGEILSLPIFPGLGESDQDRVIATLTAALAAEAAPPSVS